jgi:hypothetical protein
VSLAVNRVPSVPFMGDGQPQRLFIGGQWGLAASGRTFETRNPSTGDLRANRYVRHGRAAATEPKIIPMLTTGRTLVLNPSEETPPASLPTLDSSAPADRRWRGTDRHSGLHRRAGLYPPKRRSGSQARQAQRPVPQGFARARGTTQSSTKLLTSEADRPMVQPRTADPRASWTVPSCCDTQYRPNRTPSITINFALPSQGSYRSPK